MAYSRKRRPFRRRPRTHWAQPPRGLSRPDQETPVAYAESYNLWSPGAAAPSGTLATDPLELTLEQNNDGVVPAVSSLTETHPRETVLRCVGMLRPIGVRYENEVGVYSVLQGTEVRYAIVRLNTLREDSSYNPGVPPATAMGEFFQPDLFSPQGLGNERIVFMRSFILPGMNLTDPPLDSSSLVAMRHDVLQTLPWHKNAELSVLDVKSKRRANMNSKLYLLRQFRRYDAFYKDPARIISALLYHADFARLLLAGGSGS